VRLIPIVFAGIALAGCGSDNGGSSQAVAAEEELEVVGASMEPTLHCAKPALGCRSEHRDDVLVRDEQQVERREVVAFRVGSKARRMCGAGGLYVKRVVATAGDDVSFRDGAVYVNGARLHEHYANGPTAPGEEGTEVHVPASHVFVLGDNRAQSCDSRVWGPLAVRKIVGVAFAIQRGSRKIPLP
jgi:signal peptidase I